MKIPTSILSLCFITTFIIGMQEDETQRYERNRAYSQKLNAYDDQHRRWEQIKDPEIAQEMLNRGLKPPLDILHIVAGTDYHPALIKLYRQYGNPLMTYDEACEVDLGPDLLHFKKSLPTPSVFRNPDRRLPIHILALMARHFSHTELDMERKEFKIPRKFYDSKQDILAKFDGLIAGLTDDQIMQMFNHKVGFRGIRADMQEFDLKIMLLHNISLKNQNCYDPSIERFASPQLAFASNDAQFAETAPILLQRIDEISNRIINNMSSTEEL